MAGRADRSDPSNPIERIIFAAEDLENFEEYQKSIAIKQDH
jgi:hypothetical protein